MAARRPIKPPPVRQEPLRTVVVREAKFRGRDEYLTSLRQICTVCQRQASERFQWASEIYPCCSSQCVEVVAGFIRGSLDNFITREIRDMAGLTHMEKEAIRAARQSLYDALVEIGVDAAFENCTAEQIDQVIEAVWNGLRASMHQQSAKGEFPF